MIEAHKLEQAQNWLGVSCGNFAVPQCAWSIDRLVCYPTLFNQSRTIVCHSVVAWEVPPADELTNLLTWGWLTVKGEHITWAVGEKVNNTVLFSLYLDLLRRHKPDPMKYYGLLPVHPIAAMLRGPLNKK